MSIDLSRPRAIVQAKLMNDSCTIVTPGTPTADGGGATTPGTPTEVVTACAFSVASGIEATEAIVSVRGVYRLSVPVATAIDETCSVRFQGRVYNVVWAPPVTALALARRVGLREAR